MIWGKEHSDRHQAWLNELAQSEQTQLSFTNTTREDQWARIWAANEGAANTSNILTSLKSGYAPQAIAYNSYNQYLYVVNQLSGSITVYTENGQLIKEIQLEEELISTSSPVDISINTSNGEAYVIGSLSNKLYKLSTKLEVTANYSIAVRPIRVSYNSSNGLVYIIHTYTPQLSVIDPNNGVLQQSIELDEVPQCFEISPSNGNWFLTDRETQSIQLYNAENILETSFFTEDNIPDACTYSRDGLFIHYIDTNRQSLSRLNIEEGQIDQQIELEANALSIHPISETGFLISTNEEIIRVDQTYSITGRYVSSITEENWISHSNERSIWQVDPIQSNVRVIPIGEINPIKASENYDDSLQEFQYQPVLLKHLKLHYSGENNLPLLRVGTKSSSGKRTSNLISLCKYRSPQHFSPIFEVMEMRGKIIDGKSFWELLIPPEQTVTMVIYYD